jgi:hypothetical protein
MSSSISKRIYHNRGRTHGTVMSQFGFRETGIPYGASVRFLCRKTLIWIFLAVATIPCLGADFELSLDMSFREWVRPTGGNLSRDMDLAQLRNTGENSSQNTISPPGPASWNYCSPTTGSVQGCYNPGKCPLNGSCPQGSSLCQSPKKDHGLYALNQLATNGCNKASGGGTRMRFVDHFYLDPSTSDPSSTLVREHSKRPLVERLRRSICRQLQTELALDWWSTFFKDLRSLMGCTPVEPVYLVKS